MMTITHNMMAMNAQRQFGLVSQANKTSIEKLSSGYRINRAADGAAELAISEKMRRQIRGLNQGAYNIQDGISMLQVADGALDEVHGMLKRMNELSIHAANGTLTDEDRSYIQEEMNALVSEINRTGDTTTFNEVPLFDGKDYTVDPIGGGSITTLIQSSSAERGYLKEGYNHNNLFYPMGSLDFSNIDASNIDLLHNGSFAFHCSQACTEVFDIKFTTDGSQNSAANLYGHVCHKYSVDLKDCTNGSQIVEKIYSFVANNLPSTASSSSILPGVKVSHSNNLIKDGVQLLVVANSNGQSTEQSATNYFPRSGYPDSGKITCTALTAIRPTNLFKTFDIQCSSEVTDVESFRIYQMNGKVLNIDPLDVSTQDAAGTAINKLKNADAKISEQRSALGASQNRLEHAHNTNLNTAENTTAAESLIRDTDMASEMVQYSLNNILMQAGQAMITQANQSPQSVLSLLQ
ncbi:MAG: flagellin [Lachnospiraceae bacterium]|nr:flagellin [Lachnospiraceae bacterium]